MFKWLSSKGSGTRIIALLDVGSGSVGGALARLNRDGKPSFLFTVREELPLRMNRTSEQLMKDTVEASDRILIAIKKTAALWSENNRITPQNIEHIAVFLAAPWSQTTIRTLHLEKPAPFAMSGDILKRMIAEESKLSKEGSEELSIIERVATGLRLNGYPIEAVSNAKVLKADVTLAVSSAPKELISQLEEHIGAHSHSTKITFHSFAIPASHALFLTSDTLLDTILIDAGAEVTELVLLKDKTPVARATVPVGTHILLRTLTAHGQMVKGEAETALKLAQIEGTRLGETHKDALYGAAKEWSHAIAETLRTLVGTQAIPSSVHLFADRPALSWFKDALATEPYPGQSETFSNIALMTSKDFDALIEPKVPADPFLSVELLYADSRFDEHQALDLSGTANPLLARPVSHISSGILQPIQAPPVQDTGVRRI